MRPWAMLALTAVTTALMSAQSDLPDPLAQVVATERAFAAATAELGVRDGFLTFFATDAIQLRGGASDTETTTVLARPQLAALAPVPLPLTTVLTWSPFTGQVSGDGTLAWLTGGYRQVDRSTGGVMGLGAYFSVWKRQPDGLWRVWLDEGVPLSDWPETGSFRPMPAPGPWAAIQGTPGERLETAERGVASASSAWSARLGDAIRVHRAGESPVVGRAAAAAWHAALWDQITYTTVTTALAPSDDLAVTLGGYDARTEAGAQHGTWVRVWHRGTDGRWQTMFETSTPSS